MRIAVKTQMITKRKKITRPNWNVNSSLMASIARLASPILVTELERSEDEAEDCAIDDAAEEAADDPVDEAGVEVLGELFGYE